MSPPTILLVEDNEDNRLIYTTMLEHFGYRVIAAEDGQAGIASARAELPDLILMDISIPVIDGYEATRRLKADPLTRHIPIVALTAHVMAGDREAAFDAGCDAYVAKPASPIAVYQEVRARIGPPTPQPNGDPPLA